MGQNSGKITITNSINSGEIGYHGQGGGGGNSLGGFVGYNLDQGETSVEIFNSLNTGKVVSVLYGDDLYGIAHEVDKAVNIVNIGQMNSSTSSYTTWLNCRGTAENIFVLEDVCSCTHMNATTIAWDDIGLSYIVVGEQQQQVYTLLNEAVDQQLNFSNYWTRRLTLVDGLVNVEFGQPANLTVNAGIGEMFRLVKSDARQLAQSKIELKDYYLVDSETGTEMYDNFTLVKNIKVLLCHSIQVVNDIEAGPLFVEHGQNMSTNTFIENALFPLFESGAISAECKTTTGQSTECFGRVESDLVMNVTNTTVPISSSSVPSSSDVSAAFSSSLSSSVSSSSSGPVSPSAASSSAPSSSSSSSAKFTSSSSAKESHDVVFEFDGSIVINSTVTKEQIEQAIVDAVGGNANLGSVTVVVDDNGRVVNVVVTVNGGLDSAQAVVDAFDKADKDDIVLRHVDNVYVKREFDSTSGVVRSFTTMTGVLLALLAGTSSKQRTSTNA